MDVLTTAQVADELGVTPGRVVAMIRDGRLRAEKIGRDWTIRRSELAKVRNRKPGRPKQKKG